MLRDEGRAFLEAGGRSRPPTWCCGCCASRCRRQPGGVASTGARARRSRCCRPSAAFRPTGGPCVAAERRPVARFLLYESEYPDSVASSVDALHTALTAADAKPRTRRRCCGSDGWSPISTSARAPRRTGDAVRHARQGPARAGAGRSRHRRALLRRHGAAGSPDDQCLMHFAIRYLTEYRMTPVTRQPQRAARQAGHDAEAALRRLQRARRPGDAPPPAHRLLRDEVVEFEISRPHDLLAIDVRARVATSPRRSRPRRPGTRSRPAATSRPRGSSRSRTARSPTTACSKSSVGVTRGATPLARCCTLVELIPDRFEYRPGVTYVGSTVDRPARCRRRRLPGLRPPLAAAPAPPRDRRPLRLRLPVRAHPATASGRLRRGRHPRLARGAAARPRARRARLGRRRSDEPGLAGESHVKIGHGRHYSDVPPIKGVYRGTASADLEASVRMQRTDATGARA